MGYHWDKDLKVYFYKMKVSVKVIYNYDDPAEYGIAMIDKHQVEEPNQNVDADIVDSQYANEDPPEWQGFASSHENSQGWGQWQLNSWIQHGTTYVNPYDIGSYGVDSSILTFLKNMCVEQRECHEEDSHRRVEFEANQEERFRAIS